MSYYLEKGKKYKVQSANFIKSYHYHGSWFTYTWAMKLQTEDGRVLEGRYDTSSDYNDLVGKYIQHYNFLKSQGIDFKVITD